MPATTRPAPELTDLAARRFPLLPRSKPLCRSLPERVERVRQNAETAQHHRSIDHAAKALNLAALIYSDCAMPDAARALCWRQFETFTGGGPYDEPTAKTAIQPLINIGRLHTRAGNGTAAYHVHKATFEAARHNNPTTIDGRTVDLGAIARPGNARRALVEALWMVLLSDGLRALCRAGRWDQAQQQARAHHGIGDRLLDGRQIAIIAAATSGGHREARTLIDTAVVTDPWELCVAACLSVLAGRFAGADINEDVDTMLCAYDALDAPPEHTVFLMRAGLTVIALAGNHDTQAVVAKIEQIIAGDLDAYPAAELLTQSPALPLSRNISAALTETVAAAGLGQTVPADLDATLTTAANTAIDTLRQIIAASSQTAEPATRSCS